jgi:hypothetical protein
MVLLCNIGKPWQQVSQSRLIRFAMNRPQMGKLIDQQYRGFEHFPTTSNTLSQMR